MGALLKTRLPLIGNALKPTAKSVSIWLGLTAAASAIDVAIHRKMFGLGCCCPSDLAFRLSNLASRMTKLVISNEEMNYIMKIVKSFEESGLLIKTC